MSKKRVHSTEKPNQDPKPINNDGGAQLPNTKIWRIVIAIGAIITIVAGVSQILGIGLKDTIGIENAPTPTVAITPNSIVIAIADFKNASMNVNYDAAGFIQTSLEDTVKQGNIDGVQIVRISDGIDRENSQQAEEVGKKYSATLVIWGYYDDSGVYPRLTSIEKDKFEFIPTSPDDKLVNLANPPDDFVFYINKELPANYSYIALFSIAQVFSTQGKFDKALLVYDQALALSETISTEGIKNNNANIHLAKAHLYHCCRLDQALALEYYNQTIAFYNEELQKDPNNLRALLKLGGIYLDLGDNQKAFEYYDKAITANQNSSIAYYNRAISLNNLDQKDKAKKDYETAIKLDVNYVPAYNNLALIVAELDNKESAIKILSDAIRITPNFDVARGNRANYYMDIERFDLALADFEILIAKFPDSTTLLMNRGLARDRLGKLDLAIEDYSKVLELNQGYAQAYINRGSAYAEQGDYNSAVADLQTAIDLSPDNPDGYYNLGTTFAVEGRYNESVAEFTKAIKADPSFYPAYANRGVSYRKIGNHLAAMEDYNKTLTIYDDPFTYNNRGALKGLTGDNSGAIKDFTAAIDLEKDPDYYFNRAQAYKEDGKPDLAIQDLEDGLALNPTNPDIFKNEIAQIKHEAYGTPYPKDILIIGGLIAFSILIFFSLLRLKGKYKSQRKR